MNYLSSLIIHVIFVFCILLKNVISIQRNHLNPRIRESTTRFAFAICFDRASAELVHTKWPILQKLYLGLEDVFNNVVLNKS